MRFVGSDNQDNIIENNYVHHVGKGIYTNCTAGGPEGGHVKIDHNLLHDMAWNGYPGYPSSAIYLDMDGVYNCTITNNVIYNIKHKYCVHARGPNHVIRNNVIDLDGSDLLQAIHILAGYKLANVAVDEPPLHNFNYTYENNIVCSSSGAIFKIRHILEKDTFKRLDDNVYYNPNGQCFCTYEGIGPNGKYFRRQVALDEWRQMGLDAHTKIADPLFVDRESHNYHLKPGSPALKPGFKNIDTSRIGLKKDFPYKDSGRFSTEYGQD